MTDDGLIRFVLVLLVALAVCESGAGEGFAVSEAGAARCAIYQPADATAARHALTEELQRAIGLVCGVTIPIATRINETGQIVLGLADEFDSVAEALGLPALGPEGVVITTEADPATLWVLANTELGLQHAVYRLLHHIGYRWYFPDPTWTIVPTNEHLTIQIDIREKPAFDHRLIRYGFGSYTPTLHDDYEAWLIHNRQLGSFEEQCSHSYEWHIPATEFDAHPEWFSLVDGERRPLQLCTTNPEVQQRIIQHTLDIFAAEPDRIMVSVEPNDGEGYCECDRCKAVGSVSDNVYGLANVVANAVRESYPDKWVGLFGYALHSEPPHFPFEPGVYVQVTTGFRNTALSFDDQVKAFQQLGARTGVYDYFSVFMWDWDIPGAAKAGRVYQLAKDIAHYRDLGLSTYNAESSCNWGPNGPAYWIAAQLMWKPDLDVNALMDDFCTHAFQGASEPMRRLYDRWEHGERFSPRNLKLALNDLHEAYDREHDPAVRARLDRVAMYLHWLRLRTQYTWATSHDQMGVFFAASPTEIAQRAKDLVIYSRRLMDTGMIHANPMLFTEWSDAMFEKLKKVEGFDYAQMPAWKTERTDIPGGDEVARDFADDRAFAEPLAAVEIAGSVFADQLLPATQACPDAVSAWGDVNRSPLVTESGEYCFSAGQGEQLDLAYTPKDAGHTIDGHWVLRTLSSDAVVAEGDVKAEKGQPQTLQIETPSDGLYRFNPGTGYWKAAQVEFGSRPVSMNAARPDASAANSNPPFMFWLPTLEQPIYFFVPKDTKHFVIGVVEGSGIGYMTAIIRTANGTTVYEDRKLLPGDEISVQVPEGTAGSIWSLALQGLRCHVELYDVPPWVARHPAELLIPQDAL